MQTGDVISKARAIHFIGIGGIGMSALARMMLGSHFRKRVSGSDASISAITEELAKLGATISLGHAAAQVPPDTDLAVYTIAISADNPELLEAKRRGVTIITYPEMLGLVSRDYYTIAISGTHGKTTTTGMVAQLLLETEKEPTVVIGSLLQHGANGERRNFISGKGKYFVAEACEYRRSFLHLHPTILAITNIDNDHLDYYRDLTDIQSAFRALAQKVPKEGFIIANVKDMLIKPIVEGVAATVIDYTRYIQMPPLTLRVPGMHNQMNAAVALAIAEVLKIPKEDAVAALKKFPGTWRRFEYKGETRAGAAVYDDYAHHPTEIKATLKAARELFPKRKIIVVFQPHLYSRTKLLLNDFARSFNEANEVVLAPIYAAREPVDPEISSEILAEEIKKRGIPAIVFGNFSTIVTHLQSSLKKGDVLITMGAGDIVKVGDQLFAQ